MTWHRWNGRTTDSELRARPAHSIPRLVIPAKDPLQAGIDSLACREHSCARGWGCSSPTSTLRSYIFAVFDPSRLPCVLARAIPGPRFLLAQVTRCGR
jgi:hypothetical protein